MGRRGGIKGKGISETNEYMTALAPENGGTRRKLSIVLNQPVRNTTSACFYPKDLYMGRLIQVMSNMK